MRHGCEGIRKTDAFNVLERIRPPKGFQTPVRYLLNHCSLSSFLARSSVDTSNLLRNHAGYQMQIIMLCSEIPENTSSKVIASADRSSLSKNESEKEHLILCLTIPLPGFHSACPLLVMEANWFGRWGGANLSAVQSRMEPKINLNVSSTCISDSREDSSSYETWFEIGIFLCITATTLKKKTGTNQEAGKKEVGKHTHSSLSNDL